ncbi:hypothetical protein EVAR_30381_1 [Eumeta japonica]|uniref:Uncharacterized protein n=1 Tax=Eumeta variegata TaxID=151549 RepID=A0A4C1W6S8_EUMVA|nr:hypothetical protein EVAR_30381_1 [Eumeta japonica]
MGKPHRPWNRYLLAPEGSIYYLLSSEKEDKRQRVLLFLTLFFTLTPSHNADKASPAGVDLLLSLGPSGGRDKRDTVSISTNVNATRCPMRILVRAAHHSDGWKSFLSRGQEGALVVESPVDSSDSRKRNFRH